MIILAQPHLLPLLFEIIVLAVLLPHSQSTISILIATAYLNITLSLHNVALPAPSHLLPISHHVGPHTISVVVLELSFKVLSVGQVQQPPSMLHVLRKLALISKEIPSYLIQYSSILSKFL